MKSVRSSAAVSAAALLLLAAAPPASAAQTTQRVSVGPGGRQANGISYADSISGDGRYVAFESTATNLAGKTGGFSNLYVRDRKTGTTVLASPGAGGAAPNGQSYGALLSRDGRYVAFISRATNLGPPGRQNGAVYVRDLRTGAIELASVTSTGERAGKGFTTLLAISADGRYVVFESEATNLASNHEPNIFVHDRETGKTTLESATPDGKPTAPRSGRATTSAAITPDGRYLFFNTATDLIPNGGFPYFQIARRDRRTGEYALVTVGTGRPKFAQGDSFDVFVSDDGNIVAFASGASNLVAGVPPGDFRNVFVRDIKAGITQWISAPVVGSERPGVSFSCLGLSADGRRVLLETEAGDLVPGDTNGADDVFLYDRPSASLSRVSLTASGGQANGAGLGSGLSGAISADGRTALFSSESTNLVPGDTNRASDAFVRTGLGG